MTERISVITPSIHKKELELTYQSLLRQNFRDFKWYVCSPYEYDKCDVWIPEPPHNEGDFMGENKAYNALFKAVQGELVVTLNDSIWLDDNGLATFWKYYQLDPKSCVCFMGNHYKKVEGGKGYEMTYEDVRPAQYNKSYSPTTIINFDACCSSIPKSAIPEFGHIDPHFDRYCCWGIRAFMTDVVKKGYGLYISKESGYKGQKHAKEYDPNNLWGQKFEEGRIFFNQVYGTEY